MSDRYICSDCSRTFRAVSSFVSHCEYTGHGRAPCIGNDPTCPCQDGDLCHYIDDPVTGTAAWPVLGTEEKDGNT